MTSSRHIDDILVQWGDRLFYPGNRIVGARDQPHVIGEHLRGRAALIRARIHATVTRRAPQVMVKVTGGGRGMRAIAAHVRYISKNGRLAMEDDLGNIEHGAGAVRDLAEEWRHGGSLIPEVGDRRHAFNIMLSMPAGTDPLLVQRAAREFAQTELADHRYVMVLHDHQAHPHVHVSVRAESKHGKRLRPRKADLQRWRETFAEKLRAWGVEAEATRQATRGVSRVHPAIWQTKSALRGTLQKPLRTRQDGTAAAEARTRARLAWSSIREVLQHSEDPADRQLAADLTAMLEVRHGRPGGSRVKPSLDPHFARDGVRATIGNAADDRHRGSY